ncbi:LuxR C-terminal-related transcriptional regulator, partial [Sphingopyxis sp. KK2]|uniref:helix-turn-helix transcriptional regulator n=1 Tax=Sphingopyxis sp. KK2 TaxID=1855727 RepID=UPI001C4DDECF
MSQEHQAPDGLLARVERLSATELACLEHVRKDMTSKEIARALGLSPNYVDVCLKSAAQKLGARGRQVAANMLGEAQAMRENPGEDSTPSNLMLQTARLSSPADLPNNRASAGEGNGPVDPSQDKAPKPESSDSGADRSWLREPHPLAKFFGGENRLSKTHRMMWILAIAVIVAIAYGGIVNGL